MQPQRSIPGIVHGGNGSPDARVDLQVRPKFIHQSTQDARSHLYLRYYHRCLNIPKLVNSRFVHVPLTMTLARMIRLNKVADKPHLLSRGLREMEEKDVVQVTELYNKYMQRFDMAIILTEDEARHQFLSGRGNGVTTKDSWKRPREGQVVWTYVVEVCKSFNLTSTASHEF